MDKLYYTNDINDGCGALRYKNRFLKDYLREKNNIDRYMETTIVCLIIFATGVYGSVAAFSVKQFLQYKKNNEIEMIAID